MAVSAKFYGPFFQSLFNKEVDYDTDTIKAMLCSASYTPDQDAHRYKSSVTNEVTGSGYTAGGVTLASKTVTYTPGTNVLALDAADITWAALTATSRYCVIYDDSPATDATKPLIGFIDFGADVICSGGPMTIQLDAAGMATVTVA